MAVSGLLMSLAIARWPGIASFTGAMVLDLISIALASLLLFTNGQARRSLPKLCGLAGWMLGVAVGMPQAPALASDSVAVSLI